MNISSVSYSNCARNNSIAFGSSKQKILKTIPVENVVTKVVNENAGNVKKVGLFAAIVGGVTKIISDLKEKNKTPKLNFDSMDYNAAMSCCKKRKLDKKTGITHMQFSDGSVMGWYQNKQKAYEKLSANRIERHWHEFGGHHLKSETFPNGSERSWYETGAKEHVFMPGAKTPDLAFHEKTGFLIQPEEWNIERWWYPDGRVCVGCQADEVDEIKTRIFEFAEGHPVDPKDIWD